MNPLHYGWKPDAAWVEELGVELVLWPDGAWLRGRLARAGVPRLLIVRATSDPPPDLGIDEDFVHLPVSDSTLKERAASLVRRLRALAVSHRPSTRRASSGTVRPSARSARERPPRCGCSSGRSAPSSIGTRYRRRVVGSGRKSRRPRHARLSSQVQAGRHRAGDPDDPPTRIPAHTRQLQRPRTNPTRMTRHPDGSEREVRFRADHPSASPR